MDRANHAIVLTCSVFMEWLISGALVQTPAQGDRIKGYLNRSIGCAKSDLEIVLQAPWHGIPAFAARFALHIFQFLAHLVELLLKFARFDFDMGLAALTDDM
jgi:hypothetical protein